MESVTVESETAKKTVILIPQPNGRGALLSGSGPNQRPGPGRPKDRVIQAWTARLASPKQGEKVFDEIFESGTPSEKLRAVEILARHVLGTKVEVTSEVPQILGSVLFGFQGKELTGPTISEIVLEVARRIFDAGKAAGAIEAELAPTSPVETP